MENWDDGYKHLILWKSFVGVRINLNVFIEVLWIVNALVIGVLWIIDVLVNTNVLVNKFC